jgi:folate-dependent phosphoribosylglycinamide formyltransferase PurN
MWPALKGKDPQRKALDMKLPCTGTVIHRVVPEVDAGEVVRIATHTIDEDETIDSLCGKLKEKSIELWVDFLKTRLILKDENWY